MGGKVAFIAQMVEVGNIAGNVVIGYITDKAKARALFVPIFMWIVAADFYWMSSLNENNYYSWLIGMFIEGFFIGGPYMIISAAIAADLVKLFFSFSGQIRGTQGQQKGHFDRRRADRRVRELLGGRRDAPLSPLRGPALSPLRRVLFSQWALYPPDGDSGSCQNLQEEGR